VLEYIISTAEIRKIYSYLKWVLVLAICYPQHSYSLSIIRDTEIETALTEISRPIIAAANLDPSRARIIIVHDAHVNAFVTKGTGIHITTGLLLKFRQPLELASIIAHELGHIKDGHLINTQQEATRQSIISSIVMLGSMGAAMAGNLSGDGLMATAATSSHIFERHMLHYSRQNEIAADSIAVTLLKKIGYPLDGFTSVLTQIDSSASKNPNPHDLTHPLTRERLSYVKQKADGYVHQSSISDKQTQSLKVALSKLEAFISKPDYVLQNKNVSSYTKAIAYHRKFEFKKALNLIDSIIQQEPNNPYFHELKGQFLLENHQIEQAIREYSKALTLSSGSNLIKVDLAIAQLALAEKNKSSEPLNQATKLLQQVIYSEPDNIIALEQLGVAYGKANKLYDAYSTLSLAAELKGEHAQAKRFKELADNI
jgi:predicted Zn-dependent protease